MDKCKICKTQKLINFRPLVRRESAFTFSYILFSIPKDEVTDKLLQADDVV